MTLEHPFAQYIRILGKGRRGSRSLTLDEARETMRMILAGETQPIQLGAFLMLIRVREETPEELAGFVAAARAALQVPADLPPVALDWPSYAGKRRQLPWYVLSALLLASHGMPVLMHGVHRDDDRLYVPAALAALGIPQAASTSDAAEQVRRNGFAFLPLEVLNPMLAGFMELRDLLGLRSPVHTMARMLNPFRAKAAVVGIFHPNYADIHQQAAVLLEEEALAVFKGEGGEAERKPDGVTSVKTVQGGMAGEEEWPALLASRHLKDENLDVARLAALWRGEADEEYGLASVLGSAAIALKAMGRADSQEAAEALARKLWDERDRDYPQRLK